MTIVATGANALRSVSELPWTVGFLLFIATFLVHAFFGDLRLRRISRPFITSISNTPYLY